MRDTSLLAFQQLKHLNSKQQSVLIYIHGHPGCTDKQIAAGLGWAINSVTPRRGELEKAGWIVSSGKVLQDKRWAHTWKVKP